MLVLCVWCALCLLSVLGIFNASVKDFPIVQVCHFSGIALFMFTMFYAMENIPSAEKWISYAILASVLFLLAAGIQQYFWGFKESLEYVQKQEELSGAKLPDGLRNRLEQTRLFTTFSLCNSYAAHLILVAPFCIFLISTSASTVKFAFTFILTCLIYFIFPYANQIMFFLITVFYSLSVVLLYRKFPEKLMPYFRAFCIVVVSLSFLFNLYFTGSRAAVLAFGTACGVIASSVLYAKFACTRKVIVVLALVALVTIAIYVPIVSGRDLGSMYVRLDYYRVALKLFFKNPLIGSGWGDFFHEYTRWKNFPGTEAPHTPHNFLLSFASQTGFLGFIAALAVILIPLAIFLWKTLIKKEVDIRNSAIMTGYLAWCLHGLLDINIQIAGTVATATTLLMMIKLDMPIAKKSLEEKIISRPAFTFLWYQFMLIFLIFGIFIAGYRLRAEAYYQKLHDLCEAKFMSPEDFAKIP
ncbi:MAG: O-antigen ligase family protein, partial [Candidatus Nanoarchaeia archaeon]